MAAITVKNLFKIFGKNPEKAFPLIEEGKSKDEILNETGNTIGINNASFEVKEKEMFVIMGLSGSGKSTVLRCLNRLIEPTKGQVLIGNEDITEVDKDRLLEMRRKKMSMVFQNFGLFPHRTVSENVQYGLEISGMDKDQRKKKAYEAIEKVGLKGYEEQKPDELSGGMQQRVGLARALANDPEILLMDEAFSALDPLIRADMQDELLELQAEVHKTVVFITHDLDEALKIGDRIAIMKDGYVVQVGTPEEILTNPADDYVKAFVQNVDRTKIITAQAIMRKAPTVQVPKDGPSVAIRNMEKVGVSTTYVVDENRHLKGIVKIDDAIKLKEDGVKDLGKIIISDIEVCGPETPINQLLPKAIEAKYPIAVIEDDSSLLGIVDRATIMAELNENGLDTQKKETKNNEETTTS
ncbi:MAG: glycine betaine/L-proline ABC transporter ATP-binding protein [Gracilimonas sp.]|uniref:quaternary amine ABC transporter ATP-binding protein n=1 Tax=Gracilimonas TaxID=649462 RepID=UPI001B23F89D|nr:glycine betaine/L-proline ABC transporter ATP-binding protein [Gracilimonas sp.]MBO6587165.1 glycine betaine/L-proline ABC transporter ATP-binding protein [Gracilimonas sp.]MBO6614347.1 glycine betaine/L-proline ABC transporter ATP-binding protein [Gracilimonas sp.]